jgi:DNA-binding beta-propeller fold protein YncE
MVFGRRGLSGDTDDLFNRPTDVAVNSRGEIYVADGYGNSRVVKFSPEGKFLLKWGTKGAGQGQFDIPHAIVIDSLDRVYVADRENHRIQVFDKDGHFITQWGNFELPQGLCLVGRFLFVGDRTRVVELDLSGRVLGILGSRGKGPGQFMGLHGLAVAPDGTLYTAELINWRVQKFIPALRARGR